MTQPTRYISMAIRRRPQDVYRFASDGANLPQWASGLSRASVQRRGDAWFADSPMGQVMVKFAPANDLGVMDHDVSLPDGTAFYNPFRVFKNGEGAEVVFTLFHRPEMSAKEFEADAATIAADLKTLKSILET